MKCDALIRFNFGNYNQDITDDEWCIMWNQLMFIKKQDKKANS